MKIGIFGLGYVGTTCLGCLAKLNHNIIGVDIDTDKIRMVNEGKSTVKERKLNDLIFEGIQNKNIVATSDSQKAIESSNILMICVGTPNDDNGNLSMSSVFSVAKNIGNCLANVDRFVSIVIRSTVGIGINREIGLIISDLSGKVLNKDFCVVSNPEFMREGSSINDYLNPPFHLMASDCDEGINQLKKVYQDIDAEVIETGVETVELFKLINNSFHALKISFANEVGRIGSALDIDSQVLMGILCKDHTLNLSSAYLKPGLPYGGSCLPKDLNQLKRVAKDCGVKSPVISAIKRSNEFHRHYIMEKILSEGKQNIGFFGISFKAGTDDLRSSPIPVWVSILEDLNKNPRAYDDEIDMEALVGENKKLLNEAHPKLKNIMTTDIGSFMKGLEVLVVSKITDSMKQLKMLITQDMIIIDLVGLEDLKVYDGYRGICW